MDKADIARRVRDRASSSQGPYTDDQWDQALLTSQRSDLVSVGVRLATLVVVYFLLARAILNGLTGATLLLPLVLELLALQLLGWLLMRPAISCPKFHRSMGGVVGNLFILALLVGALVALLKIDARIDLPDPLTISAILAALAGLTEDVNLMLAVAAAVLGLATSSILEIMAWRRHRGVFVWTTVMVTATRVALILVLVLIIGVGVVWPLLAFEVLPAPDSALVQWLSPQQWAWPIWVTLLLIDLGTVLVMASMHRQARDKKAAQPVQSSPNPAI